MEADDDKSLWDIGLEWMADVGLNPDEQRTEGGQPIDRGQTDLGNLVETSDKLSSIDFKAWILEHPIKIRPMLEVSAWLCGHCWTLNGLDSKRRVRRTCLKCRKIREGNETFLEKLAKTLKLEE